MPKIKQILQYVFILTEYIFESGEKSYNQAFKYFQIDGLRP